MAWDRWLLGVAVLVATVAPAFAGAPYVRRRIVPGWPRAPRLLADAVIAVAAIVLLAQLLGTLHLLRPWALLVAGPLLGVGLRLAGRPRGEEAAAGEHGLGGRAEVAVAAVAVTALLAQAFDSVAHRASRGILDPDSLHYHLTFAARFARSGSTTDVAHLSAGDNSPYHPATAELLHALGLVAWRVEVLTLVLNLGALLLALLAAAALGARRGRGAAAVTATAVVLALPMLGTHQAGSPLNDVLAIAFLLAGVAFAAWAVDAGPAARGGLALAGIAIGLAAGTKLTTLAPLALIALALAAEAGSVRAAAARLGRLAPFALLTGAYWSLRNLLHVGNPLPAIEAGLPRPPMPRLESVDQTVLHYVGDAEVVREALIPGLRYALGAGAPLVAVLIAVAAGAAVFQSRDRLLRLLGGGMLIALVVYMATPTSAGGPDGDPYLFRFNVRYAAPALCVLAAAAALSPLAQRLRHGWSLAWLAALALTLAGDRAWVDPALRPEAIGAAVAVALVGAALVRFPRARLPAAAVAALAAVAGGGALADRYVRDWRYAAPVGDRDGLVALGRHDDGVRTGVSGLPLQYSYFGPRLDAEVEYVAEVLDDDEVRDPLDCPAWRRALRRGRYDRVVVFRFGDEPMPATAAWTAAIPGVRARLANGAGAAFELPPVIPDAGC